MSGMLILLNGVSSSGKTSLLKAFQELAPEPYLNAGIDKFIWMLPGRYLEAPLWQEYFTYTLAGEDPAVVQSVHPAPAGERLVSGMHHSLAALVRAGNRVIADHVLSEPHWVAELAGLFAGLPAYLVAVRCPLEVAEARERLRRDRTLGQARALFDLVHACTCYDFEVDTSLLSPAEAAQALLDFLTHAPEPAAFRRLHSRDGFKPGSPSPANGVRPATEFHADQGQR